MSGALTLHNAVLVARKLHDQNDFFDQADMPWRVEVIGSLYHATRRALAKRNKNNDYELTYDLNTLNTPNVVGSSVDCPPKGKAIIMISSTAKHCWTRFALAKEMMHLYTGVQASLDISAHVAIKDAVRSRDCVPVSADDKLDAETYCHYAAVELMISWKHRKEIVAAKHNDHLDYYGIADRLKIPELIVQAFFANGYEDLSHSINLKIK